jgi:hypothetical protein
VRLALAKETVRGLRSVGANLSVGFGPTRDVARTDEA